MMTDLVEIRRLGEKKIPENHRLRAHLKEHGHLERRVRRVAEEVTAEIDCTACANCCRVATTTLQSRDVERIAKHLRITEKQFRERYTEMSEDEGRILKRDQNGCVFLDGNLCTIYEARPSTCDRFPHLVRGNGSLVFRMWQMVDRACYCPIVYNTLEQVKTDIGLTRR